ncbi:MAG: hypothetical protein ABI896_00995 [Actinomycetota bacterium]
MRKTLLLVAALIGFALLTGSVTQGSPTLSAPGTIRITSRDLRVSLDDHGPTGRGPGDVLLIHQLLFNKGIRREAIGHADLVCTYTGSKDRQCNGTYFLPRGKIVVAGSMRYREFFKLAVIGGTDIYDNVRGSLTGTMYRRNPRGEILLFRLSI